MNKQMLHEAGYDSYLTGLVFASIVKYCEADHYLSAYKKEQEIA
jgi:hypothetical protein